MMDEETLCVFAKNWIGSSSAEACSNAEKKKNLIERIRSKMKLLAKQQQALQIVLVLDLVWETRMPQEKQEN